MRTVAHRSRLWRQENRASIVTVASFSRSRRLSGGYKVRRTHRLTRGTFRCTFDPQLTFNETPLW